MPGYQLQKNYFDCFGKSPPRGLSYAMAHGELSKQEYEIILIKAIETKTEITGYQLLSDDDPAIV